MELKVARTDKVKEMKQVTTKWDEVGVHYLLLGLFIFRLYELTR